MFESVIDLHCHVLPGIDDGPRTWEGSLALARTAARAGTRTIVATPHVSWRYRNDPLTIARCVRGVNEGLAAEGLHVEVVPGAEIAATSVAEIDAADLARMALGSGPWLLLEPPFTPVAAGFDQIAGSLMRAGHRLMIAHPERCAAFHRDPSMLAALVGVGALTSVTAGSLTGRFGSQARRFCMRMFDEGIVHNVASDAHDEISRPPGMAGEIEWAGLDGLREWLTEQVPAAVIAGETIPSRPQLQRPRRRSLLARLRGR